VSKKKKKKKKKKESVSLAQGNTKYYSGDRVEAVNPLSPF
jgi:hypothetical protein